MLHVCRVALSSRLSFVLLLPPSCCRTCNRRFVCRRCGLCSGKHLGDALVAANASTAVVGCGCRQNMMILLFWSPWHCWFTWSVVAVLIPSFSRCACRNPSLPIVRFKQLKRKHPSGQTKPGLCSRLLPCSQIVYCERAVLSSLRHARAPPSHVTHSPATTTTCSQNLLAVGRDVCQERAVNTR